MGSFFSFVILLTQISCAHQKYAQNKFGTIPLEFNSHEFSNLEDSKLIDDRPVKNTNESNNFSNLNSKTPVVGVYLGPGLAFTMGHLSLLSGLNNQGIEIQIIGGSGLGALVGALYADNLTINEIEWKLHNLFKQIQGIEVFSQNWSETIREFIKETFGEKKFFQLKRKLFIPLYDLKNNNIKWMEKGLISEVLIEALTTNFGDENFQCNIDKQTESISFLKDWNADFLIGSNALNDKIEMLGQDGHIFGIYTHAHSQLNALSDQFTFFYNSLNLKGEFDNFDSWPLIKEQSLKNGKDQLDEIIEFIKKWEKKSYN